MNNYFKAYNLLTSCMLVLLSACNLEYANPNAATQERVLTTKEGLLALCIGIRQDYSTNVLHNVILGPAVTSQEMAVMNTFRYLLDLETGGAGLNADNNYVFRIWSYLLRVKGMSEDLVRYGAEVPMEEGTRSGIVAYGKLFRAICLGYLAQTYTHVPVTNQLDGQAILAPREEAFREAVRILQEAIELLEQTPVSAVFTQAVLQDQLSLKDCLYAFLARYQLLSGHYVEAIEAARKVDLQAKSQLMYDSQNLNPVYRSVYVGVTDFAPRDDFGTTFSYTGDGRKDFYLETSVESSKINGLPIEKLKGFFDQNKPLPMYLPGEMLLIPAEAYVRMGNLEEAVHLINQVRTKTDDAFGVNAGLPPYAGEVTTDALLEEIYYNRCAELYLTGMRLEDCRRFNRPGPTEDETVRAERNRNFYPFPRSERLNNPNTPADPPI